MIILPPGGGCYLLLADWSGGLKNTPPLPLPRWEDHLFFWSCSLTPWYCGTAQKFLLGDRLFLEGKAFFRSAVLSNPVSRSGPKRKSPENYPAQLYLGYRIAEPRLKPDGTSGLINQCRGSCRHSKEASFIYFTAFNWSGKDSSKSFLDVPDSTCSFSYSYQHSKFLATTMDAIAGLRLDELESHALLRRESALLSIASFNMPISSNTRSV